MVVMTSTNIGKYLRKIRLEKGGKGHWSVRSIATKAGLSNAYLSQLETGKVKQPLPDVLKRLAEALRCPYEDLLCAAGYLSRDHISPHTIDIPIVGECPADKFNFAYSYEHAKDFVVVNYDFVKSRDCFAVRVCGECLRDIGIFNNDIVIVAPHAEFKNGDVIIARVGEECTMKKYFKTEDNLIILQPCNSDYKPLIIDPKKDNIEIIGRVMGALKTF
jgi:SOS-response transcriptional repressor LexA